MYCFDSFFDSSEYGLYLFWVVTLAGLHFKIIGRDLVKTRLIASIINCHGTRRRDIVTRAP